MLRVPLAEVRAEKRTANLEGKNEFSLGLRIMNLGGLGHSRREECAGTHRRSKVRAKEISLGVAHMQVCETRWGDM